MSEEQRKNNGKSSSFLGGVLGALGGMVGCGLIVLVVVVGFVGCGVMMISSGGGSGGGSGGEPGSNTTSMGKTGSVGQWDITVDGIERRSTYNDGVTTVQPQGEFQVVTMTIGNNGDTATTFDETALKLVDSEGNKHSRSTDAMSLDFFLEQVNPGNESTGEAVFDVPAGTEPTKLVVEDAMSTDEPLTVNLK